MASQTGQQADASPELESRLRSVEARYEELEKKFNAISAATPTPAEAVKDPEVKDKDTHDPSLTQGVAANDAEEKHPDDVSSSSSSSTSPSRARILVNKVNAETGERVEVPPHKISDKDKDTHNVAFTLRKFVYGDRGNGRDDLNYSVIDVHDNDLWELLKHQLSYYPYHLFQGGPTTLFSPFESLIHNWEELRELSEPSGEATPVGTAGSRSDLKQLLDTVQLDGSGDEKLDRYFKLRTAAKEQGTVTFQNLWTLFPPGTLVYGKPFQGRPGVFLVQDNICTWPETVAVGGQLDNSWNLACWVYDWDGKQFSRSALRLKFEHFDGQTSIVSLPYYPWDYVEEKGQIRDELIARGKKFRYLCKKVEGSRMFDYKGTAILGRKGFSDNDGESRSRSALDTTYQWNTSPFTREQAKPPSNSTDVDGRVMVDFGAYRKYGPREGSHVGSLRPSQDYDKCSCVECNKLHTGLAKLYRVSFDDPSNLDGEWEDEQYVLCPPRVLGYVLSTKQWAQLQVDDVRDIEKKRDKDAWDSKLQLADEDGKGQKSKVKRMLLNLVESHATSDGPKQDLEVDDLIPGKGKGLVILLYGPPGVGKTSTAEILALATGKPLYTINVADVGTKAEVAEANLEKIFKLASSWQAILLIDEADVFLETRQRGAGSSIEKNALVSVFLRALEYYRGILILTTNQIAQFDVAVHSRVHIAVEYTTLNRSQKERIFDGFLKPLDDKGLIENYDRIKEWLSESVYDSTPGLDGRQIRNIITSGLGIARSSEGNGKLKRQHLLEVFQNTSYFKRAYEKEFDKFIEKQNKMIK